MENANTSPGNISSQEDTLILQRILKAVEKQEPRRWAEIVCAVTLSMATILSAWCTYQSTLWRSEQTLRLAAVTKAGREIAAATLMAQQGRAFDASMFIEYIVARSQSNTEIEKFLFSRFRPELKKAVTAWLATNPFNNPSAPASPFKMAEYVQPELLQAKGQEEEATKIRARAEAANENANDYVLLTVRFASVLFLSGISGMMQTRRLRSFVLIVALVLFASTLVTLGTMPISHR